MLSRHKKSRMHHWSIEEVETLSTNAINFEQLDEMMQRGYDFKDEGRLKECCNLWLEVWEHLKKRFTSDMSSIEDAERVFSGTQCLYNWCQDIDMELWNAWGDMYCSVMLDDKVPADYDKAERIYRMGLDNATSDRDVILDRLQHLEEKRKT